MSRAARRRVLLAVLGISASLLVVIGTAVVWWLRTSPADTPLSIVFVTDVHSLAFEPGSAENVLFGYHGGLLRSPDGGRSWQADPSVTADAMTLVVPFQRPDVVYLAGHDVLLRSEDRGATWQSVTNNLPRLDLHWFAVHPDDPGRLYAQVAGSGLFQSIDEGETWVPWPLEVPDGESFTALAVLGGVPVNVLAGTENGRLIYSHDGGREWEQVARFTSTITAFALNRYAGTLYLGTLEGVYRSQDGGTTWDALPLKQSVRALAATGAGPETVLFVTDRGEVFRMRGGPVNGWRVE